MHLKLSLIKFLIKSSIFIALSAVFYVFYFTEVIHKYADGYTNMAIIKETLQNGMKPPYLTMCMSPHAKESLLKHQNMSLGALSEPNINEKKILADLNITIEQFFRKYTFKLNEDYYLYISFWSYEKEGWKENKTKLYLGQDNRIKVHMYMCQQFFSSKDVTIDIAFQSMYLYNIYTYFKFVLV